ncbi:MAG: FCD domain-containing protein [Clostridia bacterium]|nr:FCD domain-containing protein [Clostridia bacterium]
MYEELDEKEILVLEMVGDAQVPIGSWYLVNQLAEENIETSSATVGRVLNRLESLGYLQKEKFRGRIITDKGMDAIRYNKQLKDITSEQNKLNKYINPQVLEDFLVVLEARRTVERGTARLAALKATPEEISFLDGVLARQEQKHKEKQWITGDDLAFHKTIAKASKNTILETVYNQLAIFGQQSKSFEYIRTKIQAEYMVSHRRIADAIRQRDPDKAEAAMAAHIDSLVEDVNKYWQVCLYEKK